MIPPGVDAAADFKKFAITIGNIGGGNWGYSDSSGVGALSPGSYGVSGGAVPITAVFTGPAVDFAIWMAPTIAQSWFRYVVVKDSAGNFRRYTSASATYSAGPPSVWTWGTGSSPVFTGVGSSVMLINPFK
jgi:hypothetical protein